VTLIDHNVAAMIIYYCPARERDNAIAAGVHVFVILSLGTISANGGFYFAPYFYY